MTARRMKTTWAYMALMALLATLLAIVPQQAEALELIGVLEQTLEDPEPVPGKRYAIENVNADDDRIVLHSRHFDPDTGGGDGGVDIWVRDGDGWIHEQRLADPAWGSDWPTASLSGDRLALSAGPNDVEIFDLTASGWVQSAEIPVPDDYVGPGNFGEGLSLDGDTLVVSSPFAAFEGEIRFYDYDGSSWVQDSVHAPPPFSDGFFATKISLEGDTAVTSDEGGLYIYARTAGVWNLSYTLFHGTYVQVVMDGDRIFARDGTHVTELRRLGNAWTEVRDFSIPTTEDLYYMALEGNLFYAQGQDNVFVIGVGGTGAPELLAEVPMPDDGTIGVWLAASGRDVMWASRTSDFEVSGDKTEVRSLLWYLDSDLPTDEETTQLTGHSVFLDGDVPIVGGPGLPGVGGGGMAMSYQFEDGFGWTPTSLPLDDGVFSEGFATAIAGFDETVFVGAPQADLGGDTAGAVYEYTLAVDEWINTQVITPAFEALDSGFGSALASDGRWLVVGAPEYEGGTLGFVSIYEQNESNEWELQFLLLGSEEVDGYGSAVSVADGRLVVAAPGDGTDGVVYAYRYFDSVWQLVEIISDPSDSAMGFAASVELSPDHLLIGAPGDGAAGQVFSYVPEEGDWTYLGSPMSSGIPADGFGTAMAIDGKSAVVGAPGSDLAYFYSFNGIDWSRLGQFTAPAVESGDGFGFSVDLAGERIVVGAPFADIIGATDVGSAYIFDAANAAPVADAGPDVTVEIGTGGVVLDGFGSYDPNFDPLTYIWQIEDAPLGAAPNLSRQLTPTTTFDTDTVGTYTVALKVLDDEFLSKDTVVVEAVDTTAPTAVAAFVDLGKGQYQVVATCTDLADSDVEPGATINAGEIVVVTDGQVITFKQKKKWEVKLKKDGLEVSGPHLALTVDCVDDSGNTSSASALYPPLLPTDGNSAL